MQVGGLDGRHFLHGSAGRYSLRLLRWLCLHFAPQRCRQPTLAVELGRCMGHGLGLLLRRHRLGRLRAAGFRHRLDELGLGNAVEIRRGRGLPPIGTWTPLCKAINSIWLEGKIAAVHPDFLAAFALPAVPGGICWSTPHCHGALEVL